MRAPFAAVLAVLPLLCAAGSPAGATAGGLALSEPPPARAGECWAPVLVAAPLARRTEHVLVRPATTRVETIPATYAWVEKTVTIPGGTRRFVVKPGEYETHEEKVEVHPADEVQKHIPAKTRTETRRVVAATGAVTKTNPATGALCVVEAPTAWREEKRTVVVAPARTEWVQRAAEYRVVRHRQQLRPAETALRTVPARTVTRRERVLVEPARQERHEVPAVYEDREHEEAGGTASTAWRAVLCGRNADRGRVAAIQQALQDKGFDPGRRDGSYVEATGEAMRGFERSVGLAPDGFTVDALRRLGVSTP